MALLLSSPSFSFPSDCASMFAQELPSMICCDQCTTMSTLRGCFNLDWRYTTLPAAFALTRDMIQCEEREPVDMRQLMELGHECLKQLQPTFPSAAPVVFSNSNQPTMPSASTIAPSSLQDTIASTLRSVRKECEINIGHQHGEQKNKSLLLSRKTTSGEKRSRWSNATVKNVSLREERKDSSPTRYAVAAAVRPSINADQPQQQKWKSFGSAENNVAFRQQSERPDLSSTADSHNAADSPAAQFSASASDSSREMPTNRTFQTASSVNTAIAGTCSSIKDGVAAPTLPSSTDSSIDSKVHEPDTVSNVGIKSAAPTPVASFNTDHDSSECGEITEEPETCPDGVSSTVWQFYQNRVLNSKSSRSGDSAPMPVNAAAGTTEAGGAGQENCAMSSESWSAVNVQEVLRASNASFSQTYDEQAAKQRVAALRRKSRSSASHANVSDKQQTNKVSQVRNTVSSILMSHMAFDSPSQEEGKKQAPSIVDAIAATNVESERHSTTSTSADCDATDQPVSDTASDMSSIAECAGVQGVPGEGEAHASQCVPDPKEGKDNVSQIASHVHSEVRTSGSTSLVTAALDNKRDGYELSSATSTMIASTTTTTTEKSASSNLATSVSNISASPSITQPQYLHSNAVTKPYSSLAVDSSPAFRYPYGAVMASSANQPLASLVPQESRTTRLAAASTGGSEDTSSTSCVPGTLANPASVRLSNLVVYSSDDDDDDDDDDDNEEGKEEDISTGHGTAAAAGGDDHDASMTADVLSPDGVGNDDLSMLSPSNIAEWQVLDEATDEVDNPGSDAAGKENSADSVVVTNAATVDGGSDGTGKDDDQSATAPVYPVSMTGACPYCFSSDVVYIILCPESQPDADLPPLLRNLLLCGCAEKLPPPEDGQEVPSFQCRSCGYGFNLNWVATSLEAIFGVNDEPVDLDPGKTDDGASPSPGSESPTCNTPAKEEDLEDKPVTEAEDAVVGPEHDAASQGHGQGSDWDIYWEQLTSAQKADYTEWYATHVRQQAALHAISSSLPAPFVPIPVPNSKPTAASYTAINIAVNTAKKPSETTAGSTVDDSTEAAEQPGRTERQLLASLPEEVHQLEALLSRIDKAKAEEQPKDTNNSCSVDKPAELTATDKPWWQVVAERPVLTAEDISLSAPAASGSCSGSSPASSPAPSASSPTIAAAATAEMPTGPVASPDKLPSSSSSDTAAVSTPTASSCGTVDSYVAQSGSVSTGSGVHSSHGNGTSAGGYVKQYEEYSVQGAFNPYTGKFQKNSALFQKAASSSEDHTIRHMQHHFDTEELTIGPEQPPPKKPKLSRTDIEHLKVKKKEKKRQLRVNGS
eukprot:scpid17946/ scgid29916/ 